MRSVPSPTADLSARTADAANSHALGVRRMFDRISPTYDTLNHLLSAGMEYDSNVILTGRDQPLPEDISSSDDVRGTWLASGDQPSG